MKASSENVFSTELLCIWQVASALEKMLGAPALLVPLGQASDACHLANERISRTNLVRGKNVLRNLLEEIATI